MTAALPTTKRAFLDLWSRMKPWLLANGSAVYAPSNPYEVARFLAADGLVAIVYINGAGRVTSWMNGADVAATAFLDGRPWRAVARTRRDAKTVQDYRALVRRDGTGCMYCAQPLTLEAATIEHVVPITAGGTNHLANKALACAAHNAQAGHLSAREKLELAIRIRQQVPPAGGNGIPGRRQAPVHDNHERTL